MGGNNNMSPPPSAGMHHPSFIPAVPLLPPDNHIAIPTLNTHTSTYLPTYLLEYERQK